MPKRLLTLSEAATRLDRSHATVERLIRAGKLPVIQTHPNGHRRFRAEDVDALLVPRTPESAS